MRISDWSADGCSTDLIEYAFSMADQATIERAVQRLHARGAQAVVVVRVFGPAESFRASIERMLGMDIDDGAHAVPPMNNSPHHGHAMAAPERHIRWEEQPSELQSPMHTPVSLLCL